MSAALGLPALADDSGIEVDALRGWPGPPLGALARPRGKRRGPAPRADRRGGPAQPGRPAGPLRLRGRALPAARPSR